MLTSQFSGLHVLRASILHHDSDRSSVPHRRMKHVPQLQSWWQNVIACHYHVIIYHHSDYNPTWLLFQGSFIISINNSGYSKAFMSTSEWSPMIKLFQLEAQYGYGSKKNRYGSLRRYAVIRTYGTKDLHRWSQMNPISSKGHGFGWIGGMDQEYGSPVRPWYGSGPYILSCSHMHRTHSHNPTHVVCPTINYLLSLAMALVNGLASGLHTITMVKFGMVYDIALPT